MMPPPSLLLSVLAVVAAVASAQEGRISWATDFRQAHQSAQAEGKPLLALFTVGSLCPVCESLESSVFAKDEYAEAAARAFVHVRLDYTSANAKDKASQVLAASARLKGFPTVYLLDQEGWPFFAIEGYTGDEAGIFAAKLLAARTEEGRPAALRAKGSDGFRELLAWYREKKLPLGETMAAAALFDQASAAEKAEFAPLMVAADLARDGRSGARRHLDAVRLEDPKGEKGLRSETLRSAGSQLLRLEAWDDAARCFEALVVLDAASVPTRLEGELGLAYAYRKLDAPCLAREHYQHALSLADQGEGDAADGLKKHVATQLRRIESCAEGRCDCAKKRVKGD